MSFLSGQEGDHSARIALFACFSIVAPALFVLCLAKAKKQKEGTFAAGSGSLQAAHEGD
jgi:hypothetical protein